MDPPPGFVFAAYYPEGPHAGPISIGLFGTQDGDLLPLFSTREKAISFAITTLGSPPSESEAWDGIELLPADLLRLLLESETIRYVTLDPPPSGEAELLPVQGFMERLSRELEGPEQLPPDFRSRMVQLLVYGDVS